MAAVPGPIVWRHGLPLPGSAPMTLPELLAAVRTRAGSGVVLNDGGTTATWTDLETGAARLAHAWSAQVRPGDRVSIHLPNGRAHLLAELATWRLGAVAAPRAPGLPPCPGAALVISDTAAVLSAAARGPGRDPVAVSPQDPCLLLATSGSQGHPRGVILTHGNLCSQQAAFAQIWPEVGPGDRLASYLPWHHSFGGLAERLWALVRGASITVVPGGGRDHPVFLATVAAVRPTVFLSVPKLHRVATLAGVLDPRALRFAFTAGAPIGPAEAAWYERHGVPLHEGWGLTETSPSATIATAARPLGVVGPPIPGVSVGVAADGRVLVAGPGLMAGYDGDPVATDAVCGHDPTVGRWIDSGDLGTWTDGGLHLIGRADQTVKLANGEKAHLGSLASYLEGQAGVRAAVVHAPDGSHLEAVLAPLAGSDAQDLIAAVMAYNQAQHRPWLRIVRAWRLGREPTVENGLLTPSMKVVRAAWLGDTSRTPLAVAHA